MKSRPQRKPNSIYLGLSIVTIENSLSVTVFYFEDWKCLRMITKTENRIRETISDT